MKVRDLLEIIDKAAQFNPGILDYEIETARGDGSEAYDIEVSPEFSTVTILEHYKK